MFAAMEMESEVLLEIYLFIPDMCFEKRNHDSQKIRYHYCTFRIQSKPVKQGKCQYACKLFTCIDCPVSNPIAVLGG